MCCCGGKEYRTATVGSGFSSLAIVRKSSLERTRVHLLTSSSRMSGEADLGQRKSPRRYSDFRDRMFECRTYTPHGKAIRVSPSGYTRGSGAGYVDCPSIDMGPILWRRCGSWCF